MLDEATTPDIPLNRTLSCQLSKFSIPFANEPSRSFPPDAAEPALAGERLDADESRPMIFLSPGAAQAPENKRFERANPRNSKRIRPAKGRDSRSPRARSRSAALFPDSARSRRSGPEARRLPSGSRPERSPKAIENARSRPGRGPRALRRPSDGGAGGELGAGGKGQPLRRGRRSGGRRGRTTRKGSAFIRLSPVWATKCVRKQAASSTSSQGRLRTFSGTLMSPLTGSSFDRLGRRPVEQAPFKRLGVDRKQRRSGG